MLLTLAEEMLKYVFSAVLEERADDMAFFQQRVDKTVLERLDSVINNDFVRLDYTDAITILENCDKKFENPVSWGVDLNSEHERYLAEEHFQRSCSSYKTTRKILSHFTCA